MGVTISEFRKAMPAFAEELDYDDIIIQPALELAICELGEDPSYWGGDCKYEKLVFFLTAHHLTIIERQISGDSGQVGSISRRRAGDVQVYYTEAMSPSDANIFTNVLYSTSYGQYFMMLKKRFRLTASQTVSTGGGRGIIY